MFELMKDFDNPNFNVDKYTKQLLKECIGGHDLQKCKKEIQVYSEQTSATLKKSVYANYMKFIETAKEVTHLESEMTQLSLLLQEQHNILSSLLDEKSPSATIQHQQQPQNDNLTKENSMKEDAIDNVQATIHAIKEMVLGFTGNLDGKHFLKEGALTELDNTDYRPIQRVFFFLFNDLLIVCKIKYDKKLEYVTEYDPKKIAVINIKDLDGVKNAINIITPDGSKIYQCITAVGKAEWIEQLEVAFRWDQRKKIRKSAAPQPPKPKPNAEVKQSSLEISHHNDINHVSPVGIVETCPDWITTANEEIQTLIAQRHFEDAEALIKRSQEYLSQESTNTSSTTVVPTDFVEKLQQMEKQLTDVLLKELSKSHARNLQVVLRSSKRCLLILVKMGKTRQACGTLLKVCSLALRAGQREARRNNAPISELFFCDLAQVACQFMLSFEAQPACVSTLVVWCNTELQYFANQLKKHYLTKGSHLESVTKCIDGVRQQCSKLTEIGLDLSYHFEGLLRADLEELIKESRARLIDAVGRTEDIWQPYNLQTKINLKRLLNEFDQFGLDIRSYTTGETWINLTQPTVNFSKHYLQITNHCAILAKIECLSNSCQKLLRDLWLAQKSINPPTSLVVDPNFILKNKAFLADTLLPLAIKKFLEISNAKGDILLALQQQQQQPQIPLTKTLPRPVPAKRRNVYQTDVF